MRDAEKTARLNDLLRQTFLTGRVVMTRGVAELPEETRARVLSMVRSYDDFDVLAGAQQERDFGAFEYQGQGYFWKIDCYDADLKYLSPDPANPDVTRRVLTIMLADEY